MPLIFCKLFYQLWGRWFLFKTFFKLFYAHRKTGFTLLPGEQVILSPPKNKIMNRWFTRARICEISVSIKKELIDSCADRISGVKSFKVGGRIFNYDVNHDKN